MIVWLNHDGSVGEIVSSYVLTDEDGNTYSAFSQREGNLAAGGIFVYFEGGNRSGGLTYSTWQLPSGDNSTYKSVAASWQKKCTIAFDKSRDMRLFKAEQEYLMQYFPFPSGLISEGGNGIYQTGVDDDVNGVTYSYGPILFSVAENAVVKETTITRTEYQELTANIGSKLDKIENKNSIVYVRNEEGTQTSLPYSTEAVADSIVQRDADGNIQINDGDMENLKKNFVHKSASSEGDSQAVLTGLSSYYTGTDGVEVNYGQNPSEFFVSVTDKDTGKSAGAIDLEAKEYKFAYDDAVDVFSSDGDVTAIKSPMGSASVSLVNGEATINAYTTTIALPSSGGSLKIGNIATITTGSQSYFSGAIVFGNQVVFNGSAFYSKAPQMSQELANKQYVDDNAVPSQSAGDKGKVLVADGEGGVSWGVSPTAEGDNYWSGYNAFNGDVAVNGTLTATKFVDVQAKTVSTSEYTIGLAKGNESKITTYIGLYATKYNGSDDGALVWDNTGTAYVGDATVSSDGKITDPNNTLQPLMTRAEASTLSSGCLLAWDGDNLRAVRSTSIVPLTFYQVGEGVSANTISRPYLDGNGFYQSMVNNVHDDGKNSDYQYRMNFDGEADEAYIDFHLSKTGSIHTAVTGANAYINTIVKGDEAFFFTQLSGYAQLSLVAVGDDTAKSLNYVSLASGYNGDEGTDGAPMLFLYNGAQKKANAYGFAFDCSRNQIGYVTIEDGKYKFNDVNYVPRLDTDGFKVYAHSGSAQFELSYDLLATASTIAQRTGNGNVLMTTPTEANAGANKAYVDGALSSKLDVKAGGNGNYIQIDEIDNTLGNALVRFKSAEGKNVFGGVGYNAVLMGNSDRPYYSKDGSDFNGVELALKSDLGLLFTATRSSTEASE